MMFSSEASKAGLMPPIGATQEELDKFRNSIDPDTMGFDGMEVGDLDEFEDREDVDPNELHEQE